MSVSKIHAWEKNRIYFQNGYNYEIEIKPNDSIHYSGKDFNAYLITVSDSPCWAMEKGKKIEFKISPEQLRKIANEMLHMDTMRELKRELE